MWCDTGRAEEGIMNSLKREDLEPLRKHLKDLSEFICSSYIREVPYFFRFIENMYNNLEICVLVQYEGWERIESLLIRDWSAANQTLIGIPDFDIAQDDPEVKEVLVCRFIELISGVENYLKR